MRLKLSSVVLLLGASAVMGSGVGYSKLYLYHIVLIITVFLFLFCLAINGRQVTLKKSRNGYLDFLYLMFLWYLMGLFWSVNLEYTIRYLFYLAVGISLVAIINFFSHSENRYLSFFGILRRVFVIAVVISLIEAFTSLRLPTSPYSEYASVFGRSGTDFDEFDQLSMALIKSTPTAFWGNPNNLAVAMSIILPFVLMYKTWFVKLIGSCAILLTIGMTGSRGAFLAVIFGLIVYSVIKGFRYLSLTVTVSVLIVLLFPYGIETLKNSENQRIAELVLSGDVLFRYLFADVMTNDSIGIRRQLISNGIDALLESGGLGVGGGGSQAVQERIGGVVGKISSMHNFWIEILVDAGFFFFLIFVFWYTKIVYELYRIFKKCEKAFYRYHSGALFLSMMIFPIAAISASSVIYFFPMWLMFGLATSLISLHANQVGNLSLPRRLRSNPHSLDLEPQ